MRILAVIPARAGSKGIPNKNIRIINGKPLISYCIENAKKSKYITDIVVSSDSKEIELISRYYNIPFINRSAALCEDNVTLDAVIYDACKEFDGDYIVTMQPTSPTLRVETLDAAIEYSISGGFDTVISAVNKPHLAWVENDNGVVPAYKERLNRQFLPKYFLETGAFLISRREIVSEKTRIGNKVSVYEIADDEAIDIDDFQDFLSAENILKKKKIGIVVNGNNMIGMGHISRMLELADFFYSKPDIYFNQNETEKRSFGNTTYNLVPFSNEADLIEMISEGNYQVIINDILDTSEVYVKKLKDVVPKVVNFEDSGDGGKLADLVINALYEESKSHNRVCFGKDYYFVPKLFLLYDPISINSCVKNVFICFGGADPQNYTERLLKILTEKKYYHINFTVVLGKAKKGYQEIIDKYRQSNINILFDVKNMPELMSRNDVAVTSMGRTCYELAFMGIPTLAIAQNEREERHTFVSNVNGFDVCKLGVNDDVIRERFDALIESSIEHRKDQQNKMLANDLKSGRERVRNLIDSV